MTLRQTDRRALRDGLVLGLLWLAISVLIDALVTTGLAAARTPAAGVR